MPLHRWIPPREEGLKLNVDVAFIYGRDVNGLGAIIYDFVDQVGIAMSKCGSRGYSPHIAKCMPLCEGLKIVLQYGIEVVDVETDARNVILAIQSQNFCYSISEFCGESYHQGHICIS